MRIVDDDVSWTSISTTKAEKEEEEDDGERERMRSAERKGEVWGGREETRKEMKVERDGRRKEKKICQYLKKKISW